MGLFIEFKTKQTYKFYLNFKNKNQNDIIKMILYLLFLQLSLLIDHPLKFYQ